MSTVGSPDPAVPPLLRRGRELFESGDDDGAIAAFHEVLSRHADHPAAHAGLADVRERQRYFDTAAEHVLAAMRHRPRDAALAWRAGRLFLTNFTPEQAIAPLLHARELDRSLDGLDVDVARAYTAMGAPELGVPYLEAALSARPQDTMVIAHLAVALADTGDFARAASLFRTLSELEPDPSFALFRLALNEPDDRASLLSEIERALVDAPTDGRSRMLLHQGAFRLCHELGRTDESYQHLLASKVGLLRSYDIRAETDRFARTVDLFDAEFFARRAGWGDRSETPVFVIGMPRSGSTLVESVLAAHPSVVDLGERNYVDVLAHRLWYGNGAPETYWERVAQLGATDFLKLAADYRSRAGMLAPAGRLGVNKMLHNYRHVGLILTMFPRARFVYCRRSALDACWSIFSNPIEHGHPYAASMETLAAQYRLSQRYMEHWIEVVGSSIHVVDYEAFVTDLEDRAHALIDFVGLPWSNSCLEFDQRTRTVQTMSSHQVRQGLYTSSIGRWRRHRNFLQPLVDALLAEGVIRPDDLEPSDS